MKRILFLSACLLPIILFFFIPKHEEKNILILGDSLSYAYGIKSDEGWVALLQKRLDDEKYHYKVINFSIPGDETANGVKRLPWALQEFKPVITIIELGANDGLHHVPIAKIKNNLLQLIRLTKQSKSKVLMLGMRLPPDYKPAYRDEFATMYQNLAKQEQIPLIPLFLKDVDSNAQLMQEDKLHPVKEAQPILLETVWPELKKVLKSKV